MARKHERIEKKITASGLKITMLGNVIIKEYSKVSIVFMTFSTHKEAKEEFKKHRKGYRVI